MSSKNDGEAVSVEPEVEDLTNGSVRIVIDVYDPVIQPGIHSDKISVKFGKHIVTRNSPSIFRMNISSTWTTTALK